MENNSESLTNTQNKHKTENNDLDPSSGLLLRLEIPLSSCSNLHLFKQLQIFLQQNKIPIEITTSPSLTPSPSPIQTGGRDPEKEKESKSLIYQSEYTPFTIFKGFMDKYVLQKEHENTEDIKNKQLLDSMFSKDKSKKEIIHSLQTLSKTISREKEEPSKEKEEPSNIESVIKEESSKKKKLSTSTETNTLYMHIKTNHTNPIDSIKGTKLYYLYQRQQNAQCAQFV